LYRIAKEQADRDGLTGLYNRRHFDQMIDREWKRARREGTALSFLMIDVDEFKHFNDTYGHLEGDDCLRRIATALAHAVQRPGDLVARYGGEEFGVLLPLTDARGAADLAHHIRRAIRHEQIPHTGCATGLVTVSTGVATLYPDLLSHYEQLVRDADTALYRAKQSGRDRVEINKVEISLVA
jgi:diguanylate cyclase (GGDEF)-like protein